jgi:hypothetical protein
MASERVISSRFAHRSTALIVSDGSRTLISGSTSAVGRPFFDWTVFGMADPLLNRVIVAYIRQSIVRHKWVRDTARSTRCIMALDAGPRLKRGA